MKRYVGPLVVILGLLAVTAVLYTRLSSSNAELQAEVARLAIQKDYLERVGWIRANPDDKTYREEVGTFLRWYFKQLEDHADRFGGNEQFDDYLNELDKRAEKGGKEGQIAERKALYQFVRGFFDQMREGKYSPHWTATDRGMRLDVVSADVKMSGGSPMIRLELALWGAQREVREDGPKGTKRMVTSASFDVQWRLFDAQGNLLGKMSASDPSMKIDFPERYISVFPAQMVFGYYELDLLPAQVARVETDFTITSRAPSGGEAAARFSWNFATPAEWKLGEGMKWEGATETTASEEEINPAKAKRR